MMRMSTVQAMRVLASSSFKLKAVSFDGFESLEETKIGMAQDSDDDMFAQLDVWANMHISYEGDPPDSYRVLNAAIMDWVEEHDDELKKVINPKLVPFIKGRYPDIDVSDLQEDFDDYIWEDQVDYMPDVDEDEKTIKFSIELVLDIDDVADDEGNDE
jgi:hypothetical protein